VRATQPQNNNRFGGFDALVNEYGSHRLENGRRKDAWKRGAMKKVRVRRTKQNPSRQRTEAVNNSGRVKNPATRDLPPNDKVDKYPDEVYGDTEIPSRR
jgi:hypothetical protein